MKRKAIFLTTADKDRLEQLVDNAPPNEPVETLESELDRAIVVDVERIPRNIVTMNSRMRILDMDRGALSVVTVVFPFEANAEHNRISVLAPLGTALLGCRVGQTVEVQAPGGSRRISIVEMQYQPEAAARDRTPVSRDCIPQKA